MADHVVKIMSETDDYMKKEEVFFEFLKMVNKKEYDFYDIEYIGMNRSQRQEFLDEVERNGIYIHQPPFFGNTSEEQFMEIFRKHPEWCTEYKFVGIEKPMTMGDIYFIRLILAFVFLIAGSSLRSNYHWLKCWILDNSQRSQMKRSTTKYSQVQNGELMEDFIFLIKSSYNKILLRRAKN